MSTGGSDYPQAHSDIQCFECLKYFRHEPDLCAHFEVHHPETPTDDEREALVRAYIDEHGHHADAEHGFRAGLALRRQGPITDEWEWGAIWTNGVVEGKWFDMGDSFAIREVAERQVDGYVDPQIVLGRRRKAGPWEPVEAARDAQ